MPDRYRVVVTDYTFPDFSRYAAELDGLPVDLVVPPDGTLDAFLEEARTADALIHEHLYLTADIIDELAQCRVISHHGKGVDNIDVDRASAHGILVANVLDASTHEVSEHVFALLLGVVRKIGPYDRAVRAGRWHVAVGEPAYRLNGKTLGLIGFGNIARRVALKARAFGMRVLVYARRPDADLARTFGVAYAGIDDVFASSDVVSLHLPLTPETVCVASRERLARMKPNAVLVNVSRGGLVDEAALAELLAAGRIFGAGLDVLTQEPPAPDNPILKLDNVVLTPHCAWYAEEGRDDVERRTAREVARVLRGDWPASLVNPEARTAYQRRWRGDQP